MLVYKRLVEKAMHNMSIIMAVFNGGSDVVRAIRSIKNQTLKDFRLIIVDDASTDGSAKRISAQLSCTDIDWVLVENDSSMGVLKSVQKAYDMCESEWIIRIDHDDEFCDLTLETLNKNSGANIVCGPYQEIDRSGKIRTIVPKNLMECVACGVLLNKNSIDKAGGYVCDDVGMFIEYDLYMRMMESGSRVLFGSGPIVYRYYRRCDSITGCLHKVMLSLDKFRAKWGDDATNAIRSY